MSDINCPYCDTPQDINHNDGHGYSESEKHEQQCEKCDKYFVFETSISYYYEADKADCLNDGKHDYKPTHTFLVECTKMQYTMCDHEINPTKSEMVEILATDK